jgi:hypothetical protein
MNETDKETDRQATMQRDRHTDNRHIQRQRAIPIEGYLDSRIDTDKGTELETAYISQLSFLSLK